MVYVFLLNWCFHSTKLPLLRGSNRCVVREGTCERMGENVHLCVRTQTAECEFCVCRCPCSLRHEDPVCSGNSSGEYSHIVFKSSWLRNLCTICEHIPSREMLQNHLWFLRQTKQMHFSKRALMKLAQQCSLCLAFLPKQCLRQSVGFRPDRLDLHFSQVFLSVGVLGDLLNFPKSQIFYP